MRLDNEWIETGGGGSTCAGTVAGKVHRPCHGLWMQQPGAGTRRKLLSAFALYFRHPEAVVPLTSYHLRGRWNVPDAWPAFDVFPCPTWTWEFGGEASLRMELLFPRGGLSGLVLRFRFLPSAERPRLRLLFHPMLPWSTLGDVRTDHATGFPDETGENPLWLLASEPFQITRDGELLGEIPLSASGTDQDVYTEELYGGPKVHLEAPPGRPLLLLLTPEEGEALPPGTDDAIEAELGRRRALAVPSIAPAHEALAPRLALAADHHRPGTGAAPQPGLRTGWTEQGAPPMRTSELLLALPAVYPPATHAPQALELLAGLRGDASTSPGAGYWWADRLRLYTTSGQYMKQDRAFLRTLAGNPAPAEVAEAPAAWSSVYTPDREGELHPLELGALRHAALHAAAQAAADDPLASQWRSAAERLRGGLNQRVTALLNADPSPETAPELPLALTGFLLCEQPLEPALQLRLLHAIAASYLTPRGVLLPHADGMAACPALLGAFFRGLHAHRAEAADLLPDARTIVKDMLYHLEQEGCAGQVAEWFAPRRPQKPAGRIASLPALAALIASLQTGIAPE